MIAVTDKLLRCIIQRKEGKLAYLNEEVTYLNEEVAYLNEEVDSIECCVEICAAAIEAMDFQ